MVDLKNHPSSSRLWVRLKMKVLFDGGYSIPAVSLVLGIKRKTAADWHHRFLAGYGIEDRPRAGRPSKMTTAVCQKIIAFYCQQHPLPGCSTWSVRWMATYFKQHPDYLEVILSASSIHRCLASKNLRLYRRKYFLQICDPNFSEKMEKIIQVYQSDPEHLFCLDECTGLQVLQRIAPDLPADTHRELYQEFEYKRHGTVSIISILEKRTGLVYTECIPDHVSTTLIETVIRHASRYPESKTLHYICDNYSSHSTQEFCQGIANLCDLSLPVLKTQDARKKWLESADKRIIFHFLPSHGSWLNLIEVWFSILKQKSLAKQSVSSKADKERLILDFTETWNKHFAHSFQWNYTGQDLYEKVVRRLIRWLELESSQMTSEFLLKQLSLMSNLFEKHLSKIKNDTWENLRKTLIAKKDFVFSVIDTIEKEITEDKKAKKRRDRIQSQYLFLTSIESTIKKVA
jgi:transposase